MSFTTPAVMDLEFFSTSGDDYGEYFESTNRIAIYLIPHSECVLNLFATISHELFHKLVTDFVGDDIDIEQEHKLIKNLMWYEQDLIY
tara:strand:+ start:7515 stop:7778 length:264 start_codon:yes stop_codon:yes gene_type:complete